MLIETNLISEIEKIFKLLRKWNVFPLYCPYALESTILPNGLSYKFRVKPKFLQFYGKIHLLSLLLAASVALLNIKLNARRSIFDLGVNKFFSFICICMAGTAYFHCCHAKHFAAFLNQILVFESNHVNREWAVVKRHRFGSSLFWVSHACRLFSTGHMFHSVVFALSCVLFPKASWNIWSFAYQRIPQLCLERNQELFVRICARVCIFLYNIFAVRIFMDLGTINILFNLLISNFSIHSALQIFQR